MSELTAAPITIDRVRCGDLAGQILPFDPAEAPGFPSWQMWPSKVLNANNVFRSEPAIAALPSHVREQAPSILFGQDELPPKGTFIVVVVSLNQYHKVTFLLITLSTNRRR
jgi:hypothetical protein